MTLNQELARIKINEAIKTGLEKQKIHRMLSENRQSNSKGSKFRTDSFHTKSIKKLVQITVSFLNIF